MSRTVWKARWLCPVCERIFRKAHQLTDSGAYHSWQCQKPMRRVNVTIEDAE